MRSPGFRPARVAVLGLGITIVIGTLLLMLPVARTGAPMWAEGTLTAPAVAAGPSLPGGAPLSVAFFTATSATSVTGLIVADTATYWSTFGQVVIALLIEIGGVGTMTFAALMAVYVAHRLRLRQRLVVAQVTGALTMEDIRGFIRRIVRTAIVVQLIFAVPLVIDFYMREGAIGKALGWGMFFSISAFNNAGFALTTNSLIPFATDPLIILPISVLIVIGGLGFPVLAEVFHVVRLRGKKHWHWSLGTRLVFVGTAGLIILGWILIALLEWNNLSASGEYSSGDKLLITLFSAISPRTAGFNSMDIASQSDVTWLLTDALMFIGAGPAGTAGGVKITTMLVLVFLVHTELRAGKAVQLFGSRVGRSTQRTAITVLMIAFTITAVSTAALMLLTPWGMEPLLLEVISAVSTVGLSTGITPHLPIAAQLIVCVLMFFGRLGPATVATVLAIRPDSKLYELPKERLIIG
ncbi:MAG: potassium transporter TrkG [Actinomycetaceae bacterium]|nr:potassium transporter TrkG [Actinomycetaceae bacterium]